nr:hypothetical protein [uncultured Methanolobus sp.]
MWNAIENFDRWVLLFMLIQTFYNLLLVTQKTKKDMPGVPDDVLINEVRWRYMRSESVVVFQFSALVFLVIYFMWQIVRLYAI